MASYLSTIGSLAVARASDKAKITFSSLCAEKPLVVYFIRRFGCPICRWSVKETKKLIPVIGERANLIVVAPEWLGLEEFVKGSYWNENLYIDEEKALYKAIGFKRYNALSVMGAMVDSKVLEINKKAKAEGIEGNFSGDKLTKGGLLVIDKESKSVLFEFRQESAGDHCPPGPILKALGLPEDALDGLASSAPSCGGDACSL